MLFDVALQQGRQRLRYWKNAAMRQCAQPFPGSSWICLVKLGRRLTDRGSWRYQTGARRTRILTQPLLFPIVVIVSGVPFLHRLNQSIEFGFLPGTLSRRAQFDDALNSALVLIEATPWRCVGLALLSWSTRPHPHRADPRHRPSCAALGRRTDRPRQPPAHIR